MKKEERYSEIRSLLADNGDSLDFRYEKNVAQFLSQQDHLFSPTVKDLEFIGDSDIKMVADIGFGIYSIEMKQPGVWTARYNGNAIDFLSSPYKAKAVCQEDFRNKILLLLNQ
jgi:hypothetical protein